jgi:hypothetical protein
MNPGPCCLCGATNYPMSMGGPSICPSCDAGIPPEVNKLKMENGILQAKLDNDDNIICSKCGIPIGHGVREKDDNGGWRHAWYCSLHQFDNLEDRKDNFIMNRVDSLQEELDKLYIEKSIAEDEASALRVKVIKQQEEIDEYKRTIRELSE